MMRSWVWLLLLALTVAALALFIYKRPESPGSEAHALSTLRASDVTRIRLEASASGERKHGAPETSATSAPAPAHAVELERRGEGWRMTSPIEARAETSQVERLLAILDARSVARYPAKDLGRYGLDRPAVTLVLNEQRFSLGGVNTTTQEQYVLSGDGVYAVPLAQRAAVPRDAQSLLARALFAEGETPVRFELETFSASLEDGKWTLAGVAEDPGPDARNGWVSAWRQATAARVAVYDGRKPVSTVNVTFQDGRTLALGVLEREPDLVLLRPDERIQYQFLGDVGKRLLSTPAAK